MNEQIKQLAEQADAYAKPFRFSLGGQNYQQVRDERFAELVRQNEREACAKLADEFDDDVGQAISKAIRARGNT